VLRRATAAAVVLAGALAPVAYADGGGTGVRRGATMFVQVCAEDGSSSSGSSGSSGTPAGASDSNGKGGAYRVVCPDTGRIGVV
jgi:hypothetical protein